MSTIIIAAIVMKDSIMSETVSYWSNTGRHIIYNKQILVDGANMCHEAL